MNDVRTAPTYLSVLIAPPSTGGAIVGLMLLWFSLGSSLLPRSPMMQGAISALSFAFGYAVGGLLCLLVATIVKRFGKDPFTPPPWLTAVLAGALFVVLLVAVVRWPAWQSEQRLMVGLDEIDRMSGAMAALWIVALTAVLMFLGRSLRWLIWKLDAFNGRHMSVHIARGVTIVIVAGILGSLVWFISGGGLAGFANARFGPGDDTTLAGITQPLTPEVSGSPDSLVDWDDLGFQGRTFTGAATTIDEMAAFYDDDGEYRNPVRVYAGLKSADSPDDRARLVVEELKRTNARDRTLLMLVATTGTGWVDPISAAAVEYMHRGDTAIAAMQYSFLPSCPLCQPSVRRVV